MITVYFHGHLKEFGEEFRLDADNPAEAVKALCLQIEGLEETIKAGNWHVFRGALEDRDTDTEESLTVSFGEKSEMHIMPAVEGANDGVGSFIIGAVLVVAGSLTGQAWMVSMGVGMMVGGIVQMTMKIPTADMDNEGPDKKSSFLFNKPTNTSTQGVAIPRGYGRVLVGSVVVSSSVTAEQLLDDGSYAALEWQSPNLPYFGL